ncbi:MAG: response regulator transcription factor [Candidatus Dormibacteraeota bacterium]|nr:response regulator transcription factor [Candidatus Dormibacteraeota bacterium]
MIRVVVADAQQLARSGVRNVIDATSDITVVAEARDGVTALAAVERLQPDLLLMDLRAPRIDAVEAARLIQGTRLVVLVASEQDDYVVDALRAGASAFVVKGGPPDDLLRAIRTVNRADGLFGLPSIRRLLARAVDALPARRPPQSKWFDRLAENDQDLMVMVARGRTNFEIADALKVPEETAATRVSDLLLRTGMRDRSQALVRVYETGVLAPVLEQPQ